MLSHKIHVSISIHAYSVAGNELAWSGLFKEQFCSLIKTRLQITATVITDEGIQMGSESSAKLSTIEKKKKKKNTLFIHGCLIRHIYNN